MLNGSMKYYPSGRKKKYNAWSTKKSKPTVFTEYRPTYSYRGSDTHIPSHDGGGYSTAKPERPVYTGTLIKGISTMHKSNAVPIISEEEAKEHASMRR